MAANLFPAAAKLTIGFAHAAYQVEAEFLSRHNDIKTILATSIQELEAMIPQVDVLVVSMLWRNYMLDLAPKLKFIQSISAGTDQFDKALLHARGVRLASAQGANERAVSEHALSLILSLNRHLHLARDKQREEIWRPMIGDPLLREQELGGKTVVVVGFGRIGQRVGRLSKAFGCTVVGVRRDAVASPDADRVVSISELGSVLPQADVVVLACPLTPETIGLMNAQTLAMMKPAAQLINVARGRVVDEPALIHALQSGQIAAAGLDVTVDEPLPASSPLWGMPNVIITPHSAGETGLYEANIVDLLEENLSRLWRGEVELKNGVV
jgi:D-2-hydroxyacid dehydrogenase (NADP+)